MRVVDGQVGAAQVAWLISPVPGSQRPGTSATWISPIRSRACARRSIVDEFALLLDLRDVYWARQGRISIDIGVGSIALAGCYFAALPVLRRLRREPEAPDDRG